MFLTIVLNTGKKANEYLDEIDLLINSPKYELCGGFASAKMLTCASETFHITLAGHLYKKVQGAMFEIEASGSKGAFSALELDVTNEKSIGAAVAHVRQQCGRLDVLVNNVASGDMNDSVRTRFQSCLETDVVGPAMVAAMFRPLLSKSENPYSIYVSSGATTVVRNAALKPPKHEGIKNGDAYLVIKAALNMLAGFEASEYGPQGLKVFAISPGVVRSNLRGLSEEARSGFEKAGDPDVSGRLVLSILEGERDTDAGCLVHKDGVYPW